MAFRFENLNVWQTSLQLSNEIDLICKNFPPTERFSLCNQIKRAADSVVLNIAEGSAGRSKPEFKRFLDIALRSAIEVVACLHIAKARGYISITSFNDLHSKYEILSKQITSLRNSIL
jgi:four helix bundle protein